MKKIFCAVVTAMTVMLMSACGNKNTACEAEVVEDSIASVTDTISVDSVAVDSIAVDSICLD